MSEGVFISYRRSASRHLAQLVFRELRARGYDVFLDVTTIDSGAFDRIILNQIAARPHFVLILAPGSLERCATPGDWLRREIEEALRLGRNIVPVYDEGFNMDAEKVHLPEPLRNELPRLNAPPYSHYYFDAFMDTLANRFLKMPTENISITPTPPAEVPEVVQRIEQTITKSQNPRSESRIKRISPQISLPNILDILPDPFEWCYIPEGTVTLREGGYVPEGGKTFEVPAFYIAKYPVTNAQFIEYETVGGYSKWQEQDKKQINIQTEKWLEQNRKAKRFPGHPVVNISWYEALAFCRWLNVMLFGLPKDENFEYGTPGWKIRLPTEQQWQRAAQGDDERIYPWGQEWDSDHCNNDESGIGQITSVKQYEEKGDSPYGVVDMAGNAWEWCQTEYTTGLQDISGTDSRVVRGGSYLNNNLYVRTSFRFQSLPSQKSEQVGFRIAYNP